MKYQLLKTICSCTLLVTPVSGGITTIGYWRCGEDDTPAPSGKPGEANAATADSSGKDNKLGRFCHEGKPGPSYTYPECAAHSRVALGFNSEAGNAFAGTAIPGLTVNWGIQCHTNSTSDGATLVSNGDSNAGGFGLLIYNNHYSGVMNGKAILEGSVTPDGKWHHLALVNDNGTLKLFVDGVLNASINAGGAAEAWGFLSVGATYNGNIGRMENFIDGSIDEIRIFTFAEGKFLESDLQYPVPPKGGEPQTKVPEQK